MFALATPKIFQGFRRFRRKCSGPAFEPKEALKNVYDEELARQILFKKAEFTLSKSLCASMRFAPWAAALCKLLQAIFEQF